MRQRLLVLAFLIFAGSSSANAATLHDCDTPGTPFTLATFGVPPGPACVASPSGSFLRLADTTLANVNSIAFDLSDAGAHDVVVADFDFRMTPQSVVSRADGFGFALASTALFGASGAIGGESEEADLDASLGVGFDINQGAGEVSFDHVSVHWNAVKLAEFDLAHTIDLANGYFNHARIIARPAHNPPDVTVILTPCGGPPVTVVDRFPVPGLAPYESRVHLMARSGGQSALHDLDNVRVQFVDTLTSVLSLSATSYSQVETDDAVAIRVERIGGLQDSSRVRVVTMPLTAAVADFDSSAIVVAFGPGESARYASIPIHHDGDDEGPERFRVFLADATGPAVIGGPAEAIVTLVDDERARLVGHWSDPVCLPIVAIHATLLPSGEIMMWPGEEQHIGGNGGDHPVRWDPMHGMVHATAQAGFDLFCSGHTLAPDGRVFVTGGHIAEAEGLPNAAFYDPVTDTWEHLPDMNGGRWYPTNTVLPNGDLLVTAGSISESVMNDLPQVWEMGSQSWRDLTDARLNEPLLFRYYPWMYVLSADSILCTGWQQETWLLNPNGTGAWTAMGQSGYGLREYGSSVMYEHGKVLITGGNAHDFSMPPTIVPSATTEQIDMTAASPSWRFSSPMTYGRRHVTATLLPDGTVLATGGTSGVGSNNPVGAMLAAELWRPWTDAWAPMASMTVPRLYHSVALLLPDGRVWSSGGGAPSPRGHLNRRDAELYSPPYLFMGPQPMVHSAPTSARYGETIRVGVHDPARITAVRLLRHGSVTHAWDSNQRIVPLEFTLVPGGLDVTVPTDSARCLPGHYMLFVVDEQGVPSMATTVRISGPAVGGGATASLGGIAIHMTLPNPAREIIRVSLTLPGDGLVTVGMYDITGRRVGSYDVGSLGPGSHVVTLRQRPERAGIYWIRIAQGGASATTRVAFVP
jgi:Domain of unknown function (DUF1929)/Calx-beta domain